MKPVEQIRMPGRPTPGFWVFLAGFLLYNAAFCIVLGAGYSLVSNGSFTLVLVLGHVLSPLAFVAYVRSAHCRHPKKDILLAGAVVITCISLGPTSVPFFLRETILGCIAVQAAILFAFWAKEPRGDAQTEGWHGALVCIMAVLLSQFILQVFIGLDEALPDAAESTHNMLIILPYIISSFAVVMIIKAVKSIHPAKDILLWTAVLCTVLGLTHALRTPVTYPTAYYAGGAVQGAILFAAWFLEMKQLYIPQRRIKKAVRVTAVLLFAAVFLGLGLLMRAVNAPVAFSSFVDPENLIGNPQIWGYSASDFIKQGMQPEDGDETILIKEHVPFCGADGTLMLYFDENCKRLEFFTYSAAFSRSRYDNKAVFDVYAKACRFIADRYGAQYEVDPETYPDYLSDDASVVLPYDEVRYEGVNSLLDRGKPELNMTLHYGDGCTLLPEITLTADSSRFLIYKSNWLSLSVD